jgi:hypothetical protein
MRRKAMRGDKVIVRTFGGSPAVRLVWEILPHTVLIVTDGEWQATEAKHDIFPIGFPKEDVLFFDEARWSAFTKRPTAWNWKLLRPYADEAISA